jgi:DNA-directed RNA polymerase specialized sigma24 family protein
MTQRTEHPTQTPEAQSEVPNGGRKVRLKGMHILETDEALVAQLSPADQAVLRSTGSYKDRQKQLQVPIGTLRSRLHRARVKLLALRRQASANPQ